MSSLSVAGRTEQVAAGRVVVPVISPAIEANGRAMAEVQAQQRTLAGEIDRAIGKRNQISSTLALARHQNPGAVHSLADAHAKAERDVQARREDLCRADQRLHELEVQNGDLHRVRRHRAALGPDRTVVPVPVPVPYNLSDDAALKTLQKLETDLRAMAAQSRRGLSDVTAQVDDADSMRRRIRVNVLRGAASSDDLPKFDGDALNLQDQATKLRQELSDFQEALEAVTQERLAREETLRASVLPALQTAFRADMAEFIERLRDVVVASERARARYGALHACGAPPAVNAWTELSLADDSKFMRFMQEALTAGLVE